MNAGLSAPRRFGSALNRRRDSFAALLGRHQKMEELKCERELYEY